jgi:S-DNA-T family DNA segregation ATPase FtsK/SpoIIIE
MAQRRRSTSRSTTTRRSRPAARRKRTFALPGFHVSPDVARSLFGLALLVLGVITMVMIFLPAETGTLTEWAQRTVNPFFGSGRYLLPALLIIGGAYVEWGTAPAPGWQWRLVAGAIAYVAFLGLLEFLPVRGGGRIGTTLANILRHSLFGDPVSFTLLLGVIAGGILVAFQRPLRAFVDPLTGAARSVGTTLSAPRPDRPVQGTAPAPPPKGAPAEGARRGRGSRIPALDAPGQVGVWGTDAEPGIPSGVPSQSPTSATFAPARGNGGTVVAPVPGPLGTGLPGGNGSGGPGDPRSPLRDLRVAGRDPEDVTDASDSPPTREDIEWRVPPHDLLDAGEILAPTANQDALHVRNEEIIVRKLASFDIEARIVGRNAGPVVTQYEVQPAPHIKLSRIEALSDDLSMALAARSIRIEAPIPGKSAVGIEIPNKEFNVVALRRILDEVDFSASGSRLTFALGRDVAGRAQAVDLAKMPHLLIAGATGSGKSVMVNALITSLLCNATPDDTRMILMDLKRVELAGYNGLPHLLVPVITEPERAKAALKWAVGEMEGRYRRFAGATARNIKGFNETRVDPADRLPYIVIVIDELADLMMREGKNVEDPIVRLAQKARATGIHMVLATQRPSVNVVTGLIKANFPSRIAFAMASQIDSRTILDSPGAEDLIGRGDMLYQPSDLPRPMRLQGVFVSDAEIGKVTDHWREQIDDPRYDLSIVDSGDESTGSVDDLTDDDADRLLPDAVSVIREYDRASASLLQRRLRIGYARAARIIDQLEARGYVGAFDGSNARMVLRRDDGPAPGDDEDDG